MPQQLTQGEGAFWHRIVQFDQSITHQGQGGSREDGFGETPPGHPGVGQLGRGWGSVRHKGKKHEGMALEKKGGDLMRAKSVPENKSFTASIVFVRRFS
jgi:hypothetical protein